MVNYVRISVARLHSISEISLLSAGGERVQIIDRLDVFV